jgi:hypothetical protein
MLIQSSKEPVDSKGLEGDSSEKHDQVEPD